MRSIATNQIVDNSNAVNTPGATDPGETYQVEETINKNVLNHCEIKKSFFPDMNGSNPGTTIYKNVSLAIVHIQERLLKKQV